MEFPFLEPTEDKDELREVGDALEALIPQSVWQIIRRTFTPRGLPFFQFYLRLKSIALGEPAPADLKLQWVRAANYLIQVTSPVDQKSLSPMVVNQISDVRSDMGTLLGRLVAGRTGDANTWRRLNDIYVPLIVSICQDKEIYLKARQLGRERWGIFKKMTPQQEKTEQLKATDPESYKLIIEQGKALHEIDAGIRQKIQDSGQDVREGYMMGRPVLYGVDRNTKEERIYDRDGSVITVEEYIAKRDAKEKADHKLARVPTRTTVPLEDLRFVSDEKIDKLTGQVEWSSFSDDLAKQGRLTRIFATKRTPVFISGVETSIEYPKVVVSGRYKGIYLDDLVNSEGRLIEGTSYTYSPGTGRSKKMPKRMDPAQREPYATVAETPITRTVRGQKITTKEKRLFLKIPGSRQFKELRHAIKSIACNTGTKKGCIPSVVFQDVEGSNAVSFYFEPKDFGVIMETLQGMSLSTAALKMVEDYYKDLAGAELATATRNLSNYSATRLGGFKVSRKNRETGSMEPFDLTTRQKQALAWMDANGNRGVCGLDTGVGKCVREDTLIPTNKGLVHIRDLNPGVTDPDTTVPIDSWSVQVDGETLPVKNFYFGGVKPTIKVRTRRGYEVEGSRIHPVLVRAPDCNETWVQTPDLDPGDFLCLDRQTIRFPEQEPQLSVPELKDFQQASRNSDVTFTNGHIQVFPVPDRMSPELGRFLGYLVAEGWTNHRCYFSISQDIEKNPEVRSDIEDLLLRLLGWTAKPENDIFISSVFLREYLLRLGINMGVAKDKVIPEIILRSTENTVRQFVRALIDAEGFVDGKGHIEFSTASEQLGRELQILLLHFGILCSRSPKKVKGYDHTYWRLIICGEDAAKYTQQFGFVSSRKMEAALRAPVDHNSNLDVVPHLACSVGNLFDALMLKTGFGISELRRRTGSTSLDTTVRFVRLGRRNPTYSFLSNLLGYAADFGCQDSEAFKNIASILNQRYFYDPIESLEESEALVMDIEVEDPRHCFVGNGIINHNTITSIAMVQKMSRDGLADADATYKTQDGKIVTTNGRFLYVCPKSLSGNFAKEVREWISDPAEVLTKVDVVPYKEFAASSKSGKIPKSIKKVEFWQDKVWDPALYVSIFFDEAQELTSLTTMTSKAALKLWHPRKICLTGSPMEGNPMEAYILGAVSNNLPLFGRDTEARNNREEMKRFRDRYCEVVGGRIIGVKADPLVKRDLDTWVKRNIFYADKTEVEELAIPQLRAQTVVVEMSPVVEIAYRGVTKQFASLMGGMVRKFRDRDVTAKNPELESVFTQAFVPLVNLLNDLANTPELALEDLAFMIETGNMPLRGTKGLPVPVPPILQKPLKKISELLTPDRLRGAADMTFNPKLNTAETFIRSKLDKSKGSSRSLLFSDDEKLCLKSVLHMSKTILGLHAVALKDRVMIYDGGMPMDEVVLEINPELLNRLPPEEAAEIMQKTGGLSRIPLPLHQKIYRKFPMLDVHKQENPHYQAGQWQQFALKEIIAPNEGIKSLTLYGPSYQYGHNLQAFDTVIHLDRDAWNSETMKQRTARAWRQGQDQPVDEITIDASYAVSDGGLPREDLDRTLDEIRKYFQEMQSDIFDRIIRDAQAVRLGEEWAEVTKKDASKLRLNRKVMELMASPYVGRSKPPGA